MTTINPKLTAIARKLDAARECARRVEALQQEDDDDIEREEKERACAAAYDEISKLEFKLAKITAANVAELALKARYARIEAWDQAEWPGCGGEAIAVAVINELRALGPPRASAVTRRNARLVENRAGPPGQNSGNEGESVWVRFLP
jgi:hypothetical protein